MQFKDKGSRSEVFSLSLLLPGQYYRCADGEIWKRGQIEGLLFSINKNYVVRRLDPNSPPVTFELVDGFDAPPIDSCIKLYHTTLASMFLLSGAPTKYAEYGKYFIRTSPLSIYINGEEIPCLSLSTHKIIKLDPDLWVQTVKYDLAIHE